jgi:hypothetical protein
LDSKARLHTFTHQAESKIVEVQTAFVDVFVWGILEVAASGGQSVSRMRIVAAPVRRGSVRCWRRVRLNKKVKEEAP